MKNLIVILIVIILNFWVSQVVLVVKNPLPMQENERCGFNDWVRKIPWRRA